MFTLRDNIVSRTVRKYRTHLFRVYLLSAIIILLVISFFASRLPYFPIDLKLSLAIQKFNPFWFDLLMKIVSLPGNSPLSLIIPISLIFLIFLYKLRWEAVSLLFNILGISLLSQVLKNSVLRLRPAENLIRVFLPLHDPSFPSGHVSSYTAFYGFLTFLIFTLLPHSARRSIILVSLISLIILIAPSRVYLGEHWPSDTLGAYLLGSIWLLITIQFYRWGRKKFFLSPSSTPELSNPTNIRVN